jgi:hypothetical protein
MSIIQDVATEATKSTPHVAVSGLILWGITLSDAVLAISFISAALQIFFMIRKHIREEKAFKEKKGKSADAE